MFFHPVSIKTPECKVERRGDKLYCWNNSGTLEEYDCPSGNQEIIGFAPEQADFGWILLLRDLSVDDTFYTHRTTDGQRMPKKNIVQVEFRKTECLLLDANGFIHSNQHEDSVEKVTSLDNFRHQERSSQ